MKKIVLILIYVFLIKAGNILSQDVEMEIKRYNWGDTSIRYMPTEEELKHATVLLFQRSVTEYTLNEDTFKRFILTHNIRYICDDKAIEQYNKSYTSTSQLKYQPVLKFRVWKDGKLLRETDKRSAKSVVENGKEYLLIAIEGLTKGCIIESLVAEQVNNETNGSHTFQDDDPTKFKEFYLIAPKHLEFSTKAYNIKEVKFADTTYAKRRIIYYRFENLKPFPPKEEYAFKNANKYRIDYNFTYNNYLKKFQPKYPEIGSKWFDFCMTDYKKNESQLEKFLKKSDYQKKSTDDEKIFAIEHYLKTNILVKEDYNGSVEFKEIFKNRIASEVIMTRIFFQSLRLAKIPFELVVTCDRTKRAFDPKFDTWSNAQAGIFYFPHSKKFIDPCNITSRYGCISNEYLEQYGIFVRSVELGEVVSGVGTVKLIPANDDASGLEVERFEVSTGKNINELNIKTSYELGWHCDRGARAFYYYSEPNKRDDAVKDLFKGYLENTEIKTIKVQNSDLSNYEQWNKPVMIELDIVTKRFTEKAGNAYTIKIGELIGPQAELYQAEERMQPINIYYRHHYKRYISFKIPAGYEIAGIEKLYFKYVYNDKDGKPKFGFTSEAKINNDVLEIFCEEYYNLLYLPATDFEDYRKVINGAADFNKIALLLQPK